MAPNDSTACAYPPTSTPKLATDEVRAVDDTGAPKPREQIDAELAMKRDAMAQLVEDYGRGEGAPLSAQEVEIVLASISDANNYLEVSEGDSMMGAHSAARALHRPTHHIPLKPCPRPT